MKRSLAMVLLVHLTLLAPSLASAQVKSTKREGSTSPLSATVVVRDVFVLDTGLEHWALDEPIPSGMVPFGDKQLSLADRQINQTVSSDGDAQWLFPVAWYAGYQGANPDLKYVVVKYRDGKACQVMAEFLPNRTVLPKDTFKPHPDGKSFYSDVATLRQNGHLYFKQAISQGHEDGHGGYYVDMMVAYCIVDPSAQTRKP